MITPDRYNQASELFLAVCDLPNDERPSYLERACNGDTELRAEVEGLLAEDSDGSFLEAGAQLPPQTRPRLAQRDFIDWAPLPDVPRPEHIGKFKVLDTLGEGGMGIVYLAKQERPRRRVALKLIRPGWTSSKLAQRFEYETQILGRLQHPGIAHIFEAGTANVGFGEQPYFAMEYVAGQSLIEYANAFKLDVRGRLELIMRIAEAVQHAHHRGVVHRDLKPSNILVDEAGQPKVLDFGVACATDADVQSTTLQTGLGQLIGTIPYMSPEQASGDPDAIDARSDVYSLGVITFELLTGRLPHQLKDRFIHEAVRIIRDEDAVQLSLVSRDFRGDLETIVHKALEKEKERRYQSPSELVADIVRYLRNEPIAARPANAFYHLRKFARRNRAVAAGISIAFLALALGMTGAVWQWRTANAQAVRARTVNRFLEQIISVRGLVQKAKGRNLSTDEDGNPQVLRYVDVLNAASEGVDSAFAGNPIDEANVRHIIGAAYNELGMRDAAAPHLERAYWLRLSSFGIENLDTLATIDVLAPLLVDLRKGEPLTMLSGALDTRRKVQGPHHADTLLTQYLLANALGHRFTKRYSEAEAHFAQTLETCLGDLGEEHPTSIALLGDLGAYYVWRKQFVKAEQLLGKSVEIRRRIHGENHPDALTAEYRYAHLHRVWGLREKSDALFQDVLIRADGALPHEHWLKWEIRHHYGRLLTGLKRFEEAEMLLLEACAGFEVSMGRDDSRTRDSMTALAELYDVWNRPVQAEASIRDYLTLDLDKRTRFFWTNELARMILRQGRLRDADTAFHELREAIPKVGELNWFKGWHDGCYGQFLLAIGNPNEGETLIRDGFRTIWRLARSYNDGTTQGAILLQSLVDLCERDGRLQQAAEYAALLANWQIREKYGRGLTELGEFEEAEKYLISRKTDLESRIGISAPETIDVITAIAEMYQEWGKVEFAERHKVEALQAQSNKRSADLPPLVNVEGGEQPLTRASP